MAFSWTHMPAQVTSLLSLWERSSQIGLTGLEAGKEALLLSEDLSCVAIREGADHYSAHSDNLAQLLSCQQSPFTQQAAGVTEGTSPSQLTQQERPYFQRPQGGSTFLECVCHLQ